MRRKPGALVPLEVLILGSAVRLRAKGGREFHGYEIARHIAGISNRRLLTAYGTLYRALARLEKMGLLISRWEDPHIAATENRPGRRLYTVTAEGMKAAHANREVAAATNRRKRRTPRVVPA